MPSDPSAPLDPIDPIASFRLDGRVAIVTGGGGAIGSDLAKGLAGAGARVVIVGRTEETLAEAARKVEAAGSEALVALGDMTVEAASAEWEEKANEILNRK